MLFLTFVFMQTSFQKFFKFSVFSKVCENVLKTFEVVKMFSMYYRVFTVLQKHIVQGGDFEANGRRFIKRCSPQRESLSIYPSTD